MPSKVMFVLEQPSLLDHREHGCLAVSQEDFPGRAPDTRALSLYGICNTLGFSHKDIFICNSLLCWQFTDMPDWQRSWQPCLSQGWLYRAIELCVPELIVTFGARALRAANYVLGGPPGEPVLGDHIDHPVTRHGIHIWPLLHEESLVDPGYPSAWQWESCKRLREFMSERGISVVPRALDGTG